MKIFFNHLYKGHQAHLLNVLLFIGGISLWAIVNGALGAFSLGAKALYDYRQLKKQKKQTEANEEEEKIKAKLYNEYLSKQANEKS